jgi:aspartate/methionine/tyrosine aminotransferase
MKYNLGFGNAVAIRQAFLDTCKDGMIVFTHHALNSFDYPDREGDSELIEITRKVIKRQTGHDYKHILLTNGATGGVVIALRAFKMNHFQFCCTRPAPWYLRYPSMIEATGLIHESAGNYRGSSQVVLIDFPSNPLGLIDDIKRPNLHTPVIIDGVYYGQVYSKLTVPLPKHDIFVGSYSKMLGLNGIRIGWIATDQDYKYEQMKRLVTAEYCGLSMASTEILKRLLYDFDWDSFEYSARIMLDDNRYQLVKLEKYFGTTVPETGMFYYGNTDLKCKELLKKASIEYTSGKELGTSDDFGRLNMGQDRVLTAKAVNAFLNADKI